MCVFVCRSTQTSVHLYVLTIKANGPNQTTHSSKCNGSIPHSPSPSHFWTLSLCSIVHDSVVRLKSGLKEFVFSSPSIPVKGSQFRSPPGRSAARLGSGSKPSRRWSTWQSSSAISCNIASFIVGVFHCNKFQSQIFCLCSQVVLHLTFI